MTEGIPIQQTRPGTYLIVLAVSFSTTLLLMGITQHLSVDIPPFPLMWTVLLGLFLIGYILGFSGYTVAKHRYWVVLAGVLLVIEAFLSTRDWASAVNLDVMRMVVSCIVLLVVCVTFNTWQYHLRPAESGLTIFYLMLSVGGALAGFFASVAAPLLFNRALEYPISLVVAACMVGVYCFVEKRVTLTVYRLGYLLPVVVLVCLCAKPELANTKTIWRGRSFYSVLSIVDEISPNPHGRPHHIRHLFHGNTTHGQQLMSDRKRPPVPTVYYSEFSGIGLFLKHIDVQTQAPISVGLIGLGVGSLASYGRRGDTYTFYEIDPLVQEIAKNEQYFTFLSESPAEIRHVTGDARICLEDELKAEPSQRYDVFIADAFSSDTIPMHLLTVEAFRLYRAHLNENGVIAVHISNRYFDFVPLMKALADELGLVLTVYKSINSGLCFAADWAFFTEAPLTFADNPYGGVVDTERTPKGMLWTDDFHSLWPLLKPF